MPTSNSRSRRGRGRKTPTTVAPSTSRTLPEEAESQQQSSNKCTSNKTEDKKSTVTTPTKRKKKTIGPKKGTMDSQAEDTLCSSMGVSGQGLEAEHSMNQLKSIPSKGKSRRSGKTKDGVLDDLTAPGQMEVESEGENRVSESEAIPIETQITNPTPMKSEYPFDVFLDGQGVTRAHQAVFVFPICVGSIAFWQGKKAPEKKCYKWAVFLRSPARVDISHIVKRVRFQLHPSFTQPERIVEKPPYELEEIGWGEFEVVVWIEFHADAHEPPVELTHSLKLYTTSEPSTKRPVVSEKYDEIVFNEPSAAFFHRIQQEPDKKPPISRFEAFFQNYDSHLVDDCMHRINLVRSKIRNEIRGLKAKAEANGVEIALPENYITSTRAEDESLNKSKRQMESTRKSTAKSYKGPSTKKMRLIIDAENEATPLRIESINSDRLRKVKRQFQEDSNLQHGSKNPTLYEDSIPTSKLMVKSETMEVNGKVVLKPSMVSEREESCSEAGTSTKSRLESKTSRKEVNQQFFEECYEEGSSNAGDDQQEMDPSPQVLENPEEKVEPEVVPQEEASGEMQSEEESDSSFDGMSDMQNTNDFDIDDDD